VQVALISYSDCRLESLKRKEGFMATDSKLLDACVQKNHHKFPERIVKWTRPGRLVQITWLGHY
jgi:hypothetical protein